MKVVIKKFWLLTLLGIAVGNYVVFEYFFAESDKKYSDPPQVIEPEIPLQPVHEEPDFPVQGWRTAQNTGKISGSESRKKPDLSGSANSQKPKEAVKPNDSIQNSSNQALMLPPVDGFQDESFSPEAQRELALSTIPEVVGEELSEEEAAGFKALPREALQRIAYGRMFPDYPKQAIQKSRQQGLIN